MIQINKLSKRYGRKDGVIGVSLRAEPGKVTALLGPNGSGKSTTLRLLLGLDRADSGTALIHGQHYRSIRAPLRTVGVQLDGSGAHRGRTAHAHLTWIAQASGIPPNRIPIVLDLVGLSGAARARVATFSLGMGQRLGIATALLGDPRVLIFDEPTNGLDPDGIRWMRTLLRGLADEGRTVLVTSHLMHEIEHVADEIVVIVGGRVIRAGTTASLVSGYEDLETAYFDWTGSAADGRHP